MSQSFQIQFDYRFDTSGFFNNPDSRETLEQAATVWEEIIQEDLPNIPAGIQFSVANPINGVLTPILLTEPIDDLVIFVGAESSPFGGRASLPHGNTCSCRLCCPPPNRDSITSSIQKANVDVAPLAQATPTGSNAVGTIFQNRFNGSNFTPWAGSISFNDSPTFSDGSAAAWFFDTNPEPNESIPRGSIDFFSTALHEIGHVLGIGTASIFKVISEGEIFDGENTLSVTEQTGVPITSDLSHIAPDFTSEGETPLMQPVIPGRIFPTEAEKAILADIGWEVDGFTSQGEIPPLATPKRDTIRGTILSDVISAGEGDDRVFGEAGRDVLLGELGDDEIQGNQGDDVLVGGENKDRLFGGEGNDWLSGGEGDDELQGEAGEDHLISGAGNDILFGGEETDTFVFELGSGQDRINDFDFSEEVLEISAEYGLTADDILASLTKPFTNVSRLNLSEEDTIDLFHDSTPEDTPVTRKNLQIIESLPQPLQTGSLGKDILEVTGLTDIWLSGAGDDLINFSAFSDQNHSYRLYGGSGNDWIFGNQGNRLFGGEGNDLLNAALGGGNNRLYGGEGNDRLVGGNDNFLFGGLGDDILESGDNDQLFGGKGNDIFLLGVGEDNLIVDLDLEADQIALMNLNFNDLNFAEVNNGTAIKVEEQTLATLVNIEVNQIDARLFIAPNSLPLASEM